MRQMRSQNLVNDSASGKIVVCNKYDGKLNAIDRQVSRCSSSIQEEGLKDSLYSAL